MIPTLSQVCSLNSPFESDIEDYAVAQCQSLELWLGKCESYLDTNSLDDYRRLLDQHGMRAPVASYQGGLLDSQGERRQQAWELFEKRLRLCRSLEVQTLIVACDVMAPVDATTVERARASLRQAARAAEQHEVRIALEFQAGSGFGNNLQTALALVDEVASDKLGICLDVFHFYIGPSKLSDLGLLTKDNLFHVQLSDLADVPREFATDSQRIMPGEGDVPTDGILARLRQIEYTACVSIEVMNPRIWQVPARQFGEIAMASLRRLLERPEADQYTSPTSPSRSVS